MGEAGGALPSSPCGRSGTDTLDTRSYDGAYRVNMETGVTNFNESFLNFEILVMGDGNDTVTGTVGDNVINSGLGDDIVTASGGNDTVAGLGGDDTLGGGNGADSLSGGNGADSPPGTRCGATTRATRWMGEPATTCSTAAVAGTR